MREQHESIVIRGARVHNLKNVNLEIPRNKLIVFTGLSGSGKSSLAFDTLYAEGQRRYVESLSAYARQFLGLMDKPDVDQIDGLSPAISIDQKATSHNPRSTVGTVTEIYDYLRLLYARVGIPHCPECGRVVAKQTVEQIVTSIQQLPKGTKIMVLSPVIREQKGEHKHLLMESRKAGYVRVRFDGNIMTIDEAEDLRVDKQKKHRIEIVVDRLTIGEDADEREEDSQKTRLSESVETALELGDGIVIIQRVKADGDDLVPDGEEMLFSEHFACSYDGTNLPDLEPRSFSFNSPHGACPDCTGLGTKLEIDPNLVIPNKRLTVAEGAIRPWSRTSSNQTWYYRILEAVARTHKFSLDVPVSELPKKAVDMALFGTGDEHYDLNDFGGSHKVQAFQTTYEGVIPNLMRRYRETDSDYMRQEIERYMRVYPCPTCEGKRLKPGVLCVTVGRKNIAELVAMSVEQSLVFFDELGNGKSKDAVLRLSDRERTISRQILKEIRNRLTFLHNVGLDYITLDRNSSSLAGGEAQRIRLATQIGSSLVGVLYILDEPSIGLHQRDNDKLIQTLQRLRDLGNTVIVVEHDENTILAADEVVDIGPGAGEHGGEIIAQGSPAAIKANPSSLTGKYLTGKLSIDPPGRYRNGNGKQLTIVGATAYNLQNVTVDIPLGKFVCITGVSGSGKSTLMTDILARALNQHFYGAKDLPAAHKDLRGLEHLDKVIDIDQSPIGRTPRSNPATYTGVFTSVRDLFTQVPEAKIRGYGPGRFSFNVKGGRCEACEGDGVVRIEMHFLPDVYVECEECKGRRYNSQALEIKYRAKSIADVLAMTVEEAMRFFEHIPAINQKLKTLFDVGLGYIHLGQPATTLSGGEAQRVKLAAELSRRATGRTLYILDEPTTGLHFDDVKRLLGVVNQLVDKGNTVLVIEHNLDVIKCADWLIDLGPEGGSAGGRVVATGTPKDVAKIKDSYTGQYLSRMFVAKSEQRSAKPMLTKTGVGKVKSKKNG